MTYTQVIPFDTSKGGTTPNLCLDNVRKGYGIGNKYSSAWEAWEHTEQHPNRDVPLGLDVPLYYSYTVSLDDTPARNYGHVNVRLANGTIWSDGHVYASIEAYESIHTPKFVGWGESVDDFKIIGQGEDMATPAQIDEWISTEYQIAFGGPASPAVFDDWRKVLNNNFVEGSVSILKGIDTNAGALKNKPKSNVKPYSGPPLFVEE